MLRTGTVLGLAFLGFFAGLFQIRPSLRARNSVEGVMLAALAVASSVAVLTTVGIILLDAVREHPLLRDDRPAPCFLLLRHPMGSALLGGGQRQRRLEGEFGLLPLLWGTL